VKASQCIGRVGAAVSVAAVMGASGFLASGVATAAPHTPATTASITSVTWSTGTAEGSSTAPVTIDGTGFGSLPNTSPGTDPQDGRSCGNTLSGYDGLDFGSNLNVGLDRPRP